MLAGPAASLIAVSAFRSVNDRTAEQTRLLAGDDRHGAGSASDARLRCAPAGLAAALLRRRLPRRSAAGAGMRLGPRDRCAPRLRLRRVAGEERGDRGEIVRVIEASSRIHGSAGRRPTALTSPLS